jgi:hypothetical protein
MECSSRAQRYVLPHIEWPVSPSLDARLVEIAESVRALQSSQAAAAAAAEQATTTVHQRLARLESDSAVGDIRSEIASLRALSLGRSQFPPAPAAAAIPAWQRAAVTPARAAAPEAASLSM